MTCIKCGNEVPESSTFCPFCGQKMDSAPIPDDVAETVRPEAVTPDTDLAAQPQAVNTETETGPVRDPGEVPAASAEAKRSKKNKQPSTRSEKGRKKRKKWPLIVLIIVILLGAGGYYFYDNLPSTQAGKHVKAANEFFKNRDLDSAVNELKAASELLPERTLQYEDTIADYYSSFYEPLMSEKKYQEAIDLLREERTVLSSRADTIDAQIVNVYEIWSQEVRDSGDYALIVAMNQLLKDENMSKASDKLAETSQKFEDFITEYRLNENFSAFADVIIGHINSGDWDKVYSTMRSDLFTIGGQYRDIITTVAVNQDRFLPLVSENVGDKKLALYNAGGYYFLYYGSMDAGKRAGNGTWITVINKTTDESYLNYRAECIWIDDLPTGEFTEYSTIKLAGSETPESRRTHGTADLGMYDGTVSYFYGDYPEMKGTFTDGRPKIITNKDPNGKSAFVIAISEDETAWISSTEGPNGIHGIRGFK